MIVHFDMSEEAMRYIRSTSPQVKTRRTTTNFHWYPLFDGFMICSISVADSDLWCNLTQSRMKMSRPRMLMSGLLYLDGR